VNIKKEKVKSELRGIHSNCHWVEVRRRVENMEQSTEKASSLDERRSGTKDKEGRRIKDNLGSGKNPPLDALEHHAKGKER
jgi:hypothetical protein